MEEIWKDIPSIPNFQASSFGRIRSKDKWMQRKCDKKSFLRKGKILTPIDNGKGYKGVNILGKRYYIHRLVLEAFVGLPQNKNMTDVNHKDGNKSNNCLDNLEWCTRTENNLHAYNTGLHSSGENHSQSKYSNELIKKIRNRYSNGERVCDLSREYGIPHQYISGIVHGRKRIHG